MRKTKAKQNKENGLNLHLLSRYDLKINLKKFNLKVNGQNKKNPFKKNDGNHTPSSTTFPECYKRPCKFLHDMHENFNWQYLHGYVLGEICIILDFSHLKTVSFTKLSVLRIDLSQNLSTSKLNISQIQSFKNKIKPVTKQQ